MTQDQEQFTVNPDTLNRHYSDGRIISEYEAQMIEDKKARFALRYSLRLPLHEHWTEGSL